MSVHKKLMDARVKLQGTELKKSGLNKFAGYTYFELGDFLPAIQSIFQQVGLSGVVSFNHDMASLTITDIDDGTSIVITSPMAEAQLKGAHPIQNMGAVETYQRRYLWMAAMEIVEHDVIDAIGSEDAKPAAKPIRQAPKAEPKQEAPKAAPAKMEGREGEWQIKVTADPGFEVEEWVKLVHDAAKLAIDQAGSEADVMNIFKVNRNIFDRMKLESEESYKELMTVFGQAREKFKEQA